MENANLNLMLTMVRTDDSGKYRRTFERYIESKPPVVDINIPGFFFGVFWFFYRKIWTWYVFLLFLGHLGIRLLDLGEAAATLTVSLLIAERILAGFFGKKLYFIWIRHRISDAISRGLEGNELADRLKLIGGTLATSKIEMPKSGR